MSSVIIINIGNLTIGSNLFIKLDNDFVNNTSIYKYNRNIIDNILFERHINSKTFVSMGDILCVGNTLPTKIILVNKNICLTPTDFEEVSVYNKGKIYRPFTISNTGEYVYSFGLSYSKNYNIGIVPDNLLISYIKKNPSQYLDYNDFGLLSMEKFGIKTFPMITKINNKYQLINKIENEIILLDNDIMAKQALHKLSQKYSYNTQGELINDNQIWNLFESVDQHAQDQQDKHDQSTTTLEWDIDSGSIDYVRSDDYTWQKYKGKTLVLVENDNPWFVNSESAQKINVISDDSKIFNKTQQNDISHYQPNFLINLRNNEDYKTKFVMNKTDPTMGYGYSYRSRGGNPCNIIENFDNMQNNNSDSNNIFIIILFFILLIFIYLWKLP
jgi:hypothetical protein